MADSHPIENWRPVVGYEQRYEVSDLGRVRSKPVRDARGVARYGRVLRGHKNRRGYVEYSLGGVGKHSRWHVHGHVLVLEAFVGPRPPQMEGCHGNGDGSDNRLSNLRWDTHSANLLDCERHGRGIGSRQSAIKRAHGENSKLGARGEANGLSKLTEAGVRLARDLRIRGCTQQQIAYRLNVNQSQISRVLRGKQWTHVE